MAVYAQNDELGRKENLRLQGHRHYLRRKKNIRNPKKVTKKVTHSRAAELDGVCVNHSSLLQGDTKGPLSDS